MANLVEFLVKVKDLASGPLAQIGNAGKSGFAKVEGAINKVSGKLGTLKNNIQQIDARLNELRKTREISFDTRQIRRINGEIDKLQAKKDRLEGGRSSGLGSFFRTGLAIAGIGSLAFLGGDIMNKGIGRQINQIGLETLVGKGPGDKLNNQLVDYAKKSIYGNEIMNEGMLMAGSGVKANNVMPVLSMIGDLATGNAERMKSIALAFSEASSTGYLTGRQELMMRTALFNPLESLSKITGKSGAELKKDMEKGKIGIDLLVKSMEYATGPMGRWYHMQDNIAKSGAGKWIAFKGALTTLAGTIGVALLPALGGLSDLLNGLVNNVPALYAIGAAIGAMTLAWGAYTIAVNWAAISTAALELLAYWPLAVVGLVAGAIAWLCSSNDKYASSTENAAGRTGGAVSKIHEYWQTLLYGLQDIWLRISDIYERYAKVVNGVFSGSPQAVWNGLTGDTDASKRRNQLRLQHEWHLAEQSAGLDDNGKPLTGLDALMSGFGNGKYVPGAPGGGAPGGDTASAITGGGVRNMTINVAKFQDKTEIHTASFKESVEEAEDMLKNLFLRIVNSGATALN